MTSLSFAVGLRYLYTWQLVCNLYSRHVLLAENGEFNPKLLFESFENTVERLTTIQRCRDLSESKTNRPSAKANAGTL